MKLRCDGSSPCGSCQKRNVTCNNERKPPSQAQDFSLRTISPDNQSTVIDSGSTRCEPSSDRGSIKFLLNGGTDSFTEHFHLPPHTDRVRGLEYHNQKGFEEVELSILGFPVKGGQPEYAPAFIESDPVTLSFFQDTFVSLFHGPFGDQQKTMEGPYGNEVAYQAVIPSQDPSVAFLGEQPPHDLERPFAMAMIQVILAKAWTVSLDPRIQEEISASVHFLLTTARIRKFASLYFKYWQPSCPIIHIPSFDPEVVPLPLLASVVFMGAMYSDDMRESCIAKRVLDFVELFVFSSDIFASEHEIGAAFSVERSDNESTEWIQLLNLQAGYILLVTQYWAGSRVSRNRAMETRFGEVFNVCQRAYKKNQKLIRI